MKKNKNLQRLMGYAGRFRYLTYSSWVLSALSALLALALFWYLWKIMQEVLQTAHHFEQATHLIANGWMAVLFAVAAFAVYVAALMCSHLSAFRVATEIRKQTMAHILRLPLGLTETYLAHQLPDKAGAIATPYGLLVLLFAFDWRLGLFSLIPVVLAFLIMMTMTGASMQKKMEEYQNALEDMSNQAVEYVWSIPVVKTFSQTVFSFRKFKEIIDRYEVWVMAYTKELRLPMMAYTTAVNSVFAF